jgi:hypothetical protein
LRRAPEELFPDAPIIFRNFDQAVLSTSLPIPGGGGACLTTGVVAFARSLACCADGSEFVPALRHGGGNLGVQVSIICIIRTTNPDFRRKDSLTLPK